MGKVARTSPLSKKRYQALALQVREHLVQLQIEVKRAPFKVLLIVAGPEGVGRGNLLRTLAEWLDPRGVETFSYHAPTEDERERPHQWRFWQALPSPGRIGLYAGSWYTETLRDEARGERGRGQIAREAERIRDFEKLQADSGTLIIKVWLHLTKEAQGRRLRTLRADPTMAWRVTDEDWHHHQIYDRLAATARLIRSKTSRPGARWFQVDAEDERSRDLAVANLILKQFRIHQRMFAEHRAKAVLAKHGPLRPTGLRRLVQLPLAQALSQTDYDGLREKALGRLSHTVRAALSSGRSIVFVFEGWDAAGKGGAIRRLTSAIDPRDYSVFAIGKPTEEEKHAHYLWRFWRHVPRNGHIAVFDRSWYGRVLVERVEGFCRQDEWRRAYNEINAFEQELTRHGTIVVKYWLHISHAEQLQRFRAREAAPHKAHKMNLEDWRNRRKRAEYEVAIGDMIALTNRKAAPWYLVPAENKRYARIDVLRLATRQIESALET